MKRNNCKKYTYFAIFVLKINFYMKKKALIIAISIVFVILIATFTSTYLLLFNKPFNVATPTFIYIDNDDSTDSVFTKIKSNLNPQSMTGLKILARIKDYDENIFPGAYRMDAGTTTLEAFRKLRSGNQTPVRLIVPSVRTLDKLVSRVSKQIMADSASIAALLNDSSFIEKIGYNNETLPALFIPNTYEVYWNMSAENFIRRMEKENSNFWNEERKAKAKALNMTTTEVYTLASIVDEETANNAEKPMIAGLYINRLKKGMLLQADPTVKFSMQDFGLKRILFKHLETDSPYNTYKYAGLPPGPIRIASTTGINSVLNYSRHNYLYMCAKEDFSGTHNFASSLAEHNINARKYQQALNKRNIK